MASEKSTDEAGSRYNKGTIRGDLRYLVASKDVRRHRLISISYISHGRCHCSGLDLTFPPTGLDNFACRIWVSADSAFTFDRSG